MVLCAHVSQLCALSVSAFSCDTQLEDGTLPAVEPLCEINLTQARRLAFFDKEFAQRVVSWRIEGASHPSVLDGLFAYGKFAYLEKRAACNLAAQFRP
jgi:hypothetical protein